MKPMPDQFSRTGGMKKNDKKVDVCISIDLAVGCTQPKRSFLALPLLHLWPLLHLLLLLLLLAIAHYEKRLCASSCLVRLPFARTLATFALLGFSQQERQEEQWLPLSGYPLLVRLATFAPLVRLLPLSGYEQRLRYY